LVKKNEKKKQIPAYLVMIGFIAYIIVFILDGLFMTEFGFGLLYYKILGLILFVFGVIFSMIGRINLGRSYHFMPQAKKLVTTGLYRWFRNPIYIGNQIFLIGLAVVLGSISGLIATIIILIPVHIIRAKFEERVLVETFGQEYLKYKERTLF
jgi:protein-S-isoprenylcysteine O-methyltransferase Ste14